MDSSGPQPRPPARLLHVPASHQVHIWWRSLAVEPGHARSLGAVLSNDERERAGRFAFERDRRRFVVARATLRQVLGAYLGSLPGELRFEYGPYGKPRLAVGDRTTPLEFSLARARELAVYAVGIDGQLGVDLEWLERTVEVEQLAHSVLSDAERAALMAMDAADRSRAFVTAWTRKEAYLKARGTGLTAEPRLVEVGLGLQRSRLVPADDPGTEYLVESFVPAAGYIGALAGPSRSAEGTSRPIVLRRWPPPSDPA